MSKNSVEFLCSTTFLIQTSSAEGLLLNFHISQWVYWMAIGYQKTNQSCFTSVHKSIETSIASCINLSATLFISCWGPMILSWCSNCFYSITSLWTLIVNLLVLAHQHLPYLKKVKSLITIASFQYVYCDGSKLHFLQLFFFSFAFYQLFLSNESQDLKNHDRWSYFHVNKCKEHILGLREEPMFLLLFVYIAYFTLITKIDHKADFISFTV